MSYVMLLWLGLRALSSRSKIAHISSIAAASVSNSMKVREPIVRLYCTSKIVFLDREAAIAHRQPVFHSVFKSSQVKSSHYKLTC